MAHSSRAAWTQRVMRVASSPPTDASPHPYTQLLSFSAGTGALAVANGARVDFYDVTCAAAEPATGADARADRGADDDTDGDDERPGRLHLPFLGSMEAGDMDAGALVRCVHAFDNDFIAVGFMSRGRAAWTIARLALSSLSGLGDGGASLLVRVLARGALDAGEEPLAFTSHERHPGLLVACTGVPALSIVDVTASSGSGVHRGLIEGHNAPVVAAEFTGDGRHIATASLEGEIRVWRFSAATAAGSVAGGAAEPVGTAQCECVAVLADDAGAPAPALALRWVRVSPHSRRPSALSAGVDVDAVNAHARRRDDGGGAGSGAEPPGGVGAGLAEFVLLSGHADGGVKFWSSAQPGAPLAAFPALHASCGPVTVLSAPAQLHGKSAMEGGGRVLSGAGGSGVWRAWEVNSVHSGRSGGAESPLRGGNGGMHNRMGGGGGGGGGGSSSESPSSRPRHALEAPAGRKSSRGAGGSPAARARGGRKTVGANAARDGRERGAKGGRGGARAKTAAAVPPSPPQDDDDGTGLVTIEPAFAAEVATPRTPPSRHRRSLGECVPGPRDAVAAVTLRVPGTSPSGSAAVPRAHAGAIAAALAVGGGDGAMEPRTVLALLTEAGLVFVATDFAAPAARGTGLAASTAAAAYTSTALEGGARGGVEAPAGAAVDGGAGAGAGAWASATAPSHQAAAERVSVFDRYCIPATFSSVPPRLPAAGTGGGGGARVEEAFELRLAALGARVSDVDAQLLSLQRAFTAFTQDVTAQMGEVIRALDAHSSACHATQQRA